MATTRFSIGIDLGTTNSVLAFVPLVGEATPEILPVPQWESLTGLEEASTLPSFLYLPEDAVAAFKALARQAAPAPRKTAKRKTSKRKPAKSVKRKAAKHPDG